jgi:hypothetical protein
MVVTCSKAKCPAASESLCARSLPAEGGVQLRAATWIGRLRRADIPPVPASELYRGDHWKQVREISRYVRAAGGSIYVCSAGYGLVPYEAPLKPYSATFSTGQPDSIVPSGTSAALAATTWWQDLSEWRGPAPGKPRSLTELVCRYPDSFLLVAVSDSYLRAITPDVMAAVERLSGPDRLAILCAGARGKAHPLANHLLPCDARLQPIVGGTRTSLNVRLAGKALRELAEVDWTLERLKAHFKGWLGERGACPRTYRQPVEDAEVRRFISDALADNPSIRPTRLLCHLRARGKACQYERFVRLFFEAQEAADARLF